MLTGMGSDDDRALGIAAGADDYMVKPFSPRALLDKLNSLLGS
jgi:DNA-binding response OmpR family regulator